VKAAGTQDGKFTGIRDIIIMTKTPVINMMKTMTDMINMMMIES